MFVVDLVEFLSEEALDLYDRLRPLGAGVLEGRSQPAGAESERSRTSSSTSPRSARELLASSTVPIGVLYAGGPLIPRGKISAVVVRVALSSAISATALPGSLEVSSRVSSSG